MYDEFEPEEIFMYLLEYSQWVIRMFLMASKSNHNDF